MGIQEGLSREQNIALRLENKEKAEKLIQRAESLAKSGDARNAINSLHELRQQWRDTVNPLPRECADALWEKFNGIINDYIVKKENVAREKALELIRRAETFSTSTQFVETARKMNNLREQWRIIYPMPKDERDALWEKFNGALQFFFNAREQDCRRSAEETIATAEELAVSGNFEDIDRQTRNLKSKLTGALYVLPDEEKITFQNRLDEAIAKFETAYAKNEISKLQQEVEIIDKKIFILEDQIDALAHDNFKRREELENMINDLDKIAAQNEARIEELQEYITKSGISNN